MNLASGVREYSQLIHEVRIYFGERRSYWLAPLIFAILMLATLACFLEGSVMAPAIYSIF
ncbi:hypothetical protein W02_32380 [Nitrospira sp. KM1]|uniref:DUF5989 family protein n=1 Tax=Nitrospira sp. KM1 TaxID=1936990 RepID=UPI0013A726F4|nr:DUF5989 family protein [Nitrospira sp. KM1]BCA56098.1 hypothetical protein W02_32380 [Nitrospira sp. KM1]